MRALGTFVFVSLMVVVGLAQFYNFAFLRARANNLGAFNITGLSGGADVTADAWLVNTTDPSVNFQTSSGATSYDVQVRDAAGTTTLCSVTGAAGSSVALSSCGLVNGGSYRAYVTAKQGGSSKAADNDGYSFSVDTTTPTTNTITGLTGGSDAVADIWLVGTLFPTVNWNAFTGAASYEVTIRDSAGTTVVCATQTTTSTSYNFAACLLTAGVDYRAYVTAKSASGQNTTAASNTGYAFSVDNTAPGSFSISGITGGTDVLVDTYLANGSEPTVNFGSASNVYRYDVVIKDAAGSTTICSALNQTASPVGVTGCSLSNGVTYRAYVQAKSISTYLTTNASNDGFSFTAGPPPAASPGSFSITGATGGADVTADSSLTSGTTVTANWQASSGAQNYSVTIRNSADTADVCATQVTTSTSFTFSGCTLVNGTSYLIKVTANNAPATPTDALNNGFSFQVVSGPGPGVFSITGVTGGVDYEADDYLMDGTTVTGSWNAASGATSYDVTIRNAGNTADVCATVNTASTSYTFTGCTLTAGTSYLLQVVAKNASASTPAMNSAFSFYVPATVSFCPTGSSTAPALIIQDSGGAGGNYSNSENCNFTISPTGAPSQIILSFDSVDLLGASDILRVYNGASSGGALLGTFSNTTTAPSNRTATAGSMYLTWASDATGTAAGYRMVYRSVYGAAGAFSVTGMTGGTDTTADAGLSDNSSGVTVNWGASSGASSYDVVIRNSDNTNDVCAKINTTSTSYNFANCSLSLGTSYVAIVQARNSNGVLTAASNSPFSFTYETRPLSFPISGITGGTDVSTDNALEGGLTPTLNWAASSNQTSYDVVIYENDGVTEKCAKVNVSGASTSHAFTGCTLTANTSYRAEVIAKNAIGSTAASNSTFLFSVASTLWSPLSLTSAPSARDQHSAVWTGSEMIVWGGFYNTSASNTDVYFDTGGRYNPATDAWTATSMTNVPSTRRNHTAVWTGTEMIVWGGYFRDGGASGYRSTGGRYNPANDSWIATSTTGVPQGRVYHAAVWTGTEMIIWGGNYSGGGRYNPSTDTWTATSTSNAPVNRSYPAAVWTGTEMIVWGGSSSSRYFVDGGRYNPSTNSWTGLVNLSFSVDSKREHTAVWTGSEMIIWGGWDGVSYASTGKRYNPTTDSWIQFGSTSRIGHAAVWTGTEMIVWGGWTGTAYTNAGFRYNPATETSTATSYGAGIPDARKGHSAIWTGTLMVLWGGSDAGGPMNSGATYDPSTDSWSGTRTGGGGVPSAREGHTAVWTGSEMLIWGGTDGTTYTNTGSRYNVAGNSWIAMSTTSAPTARSQHTAVWAGSEMIVWGGTDATDKRNSGGRYNPSTNTWTATSTTSAPTARSQHTAVWTGSEMIIWGGADGSTSYISGGRYNPSTNSWTATGITSAPTARSLHTAVWTGTEMIVWGGWNGTTTFSSGGRYNPTSNSWIATPESSNNIPLSARSQHAAVWTGSEMLIWGGWNGSEYFNTGSRYNPSTGTWTAMSTGANVPTGRNGHKVVWTGTEMIVWGGKDATNYFNTGAKYNPTTNTWMAMSTGANVPTGRAGHTAVWTGTRMLIWGGYGPSTLDYVNTGAAYLVP